MTIVYIIFNTETQRYFARDYYRIDKTWVKEITEAKEYNSIEEMKKELEGESNFYNDRTFADDYGLKIDTLEIKMKLKF